MMNVLDDQLLFDSSCGLLKGFIYVKGLSSEPIGGVEAGIKYVGAPGRAARSTTLALAGFLAWLI